MTENRSAWKHPHTGRLGGGSGYVSEQGFGLEDWNFARDIWDDGRYHLYLTMTPREKDLDKIFNIVLGIHTRLGAMIVGFAENAEYSSANLADHIWKRRAREVKALEKGEQLGPQYSGKSLLDIKQMLVNESEKYNLSVAPSDLHVMERPTLIPALAYEVKTPRYMLLHMTAKEYAAVMKAALDTDIGSAADFDDDTSFPEGAQIERLHRSRERSRRLVTLAKEEFLRRHNTLHLRCEACDMQPTEHFKDPSLTGKIIEAHHNVSIADAAHSGKTQIRDLSMLCPSCHRAIHSIRPWLSVAELRKRLKG